MCLKYLSPHRNSIMDRIFTPMKDSMSIEKNLVNLFILKHLFLMSKKGGGIIRCNW